ncbi:hypothetical protein Flavo103_33450 [Flavobacterium collinsii]|nr:hypothetical protein Flavo103_33450 [Flavobacterium collinsii]
MRIKVTVISYIVKKKDKTFIFKQLKVSVNQGLLKINGKTLDNAYLTIVYLHTIYNFR